MDSDEFKILKLARTVGFSNSMFHKSLEKYSSVDGIIENFAHLRSENIKICSDENAMRELDVCKKLGAKIITYKNTEYPRYLKTIRPFPLVLTCIGNTSLLNHERKVAIVGSRNCSINTFNFTKRISKEISSYGYIVVSGLARGVDAAGHIGSLENGTIAVLGSAIDNIYPKENEHLYHEIVDKNGLIISEFPMDTKPRPENFPIRNRTITGLSKGVLIVSAGPVSGSLHTANQALKYGREVLVFPGNPYDDNYIGSNKLLQQGATMVIDAKDIIENLESFNMPENTEIMNVNPRQNSENTEVSAGKKESNVVVCEEDKPAMEEDLRELTAEEMVLSKLDHNPVEVGELIDHIDLEIDKINSILMKLNLEGKISIEGGRVCLLGNSSGNH
ncbi:MAG: DNA-processing protein DprA [Rickettsiales bacterium]|nr:DNA-processing protein DprA [Rickettsiales bacterium]